MVDALWIILHIRMHYLNQHRLFVLFVYQINPMIVMNISLCVCYRLISSRNTFPSHYQIWRSRSQMSVWDLPSAIASSPDGEQDPRGNEKKKLQRNSKGGDELEVEAATAVLPAMGKKEPKQQAELTPAKLSDKNINPNFYSVIKTMLSISQRIGTVEAAILVLFTHPTICIVIEDTQATGKAYAQAIASEGKGHRRCPPHILNSENCFRAAKKALATLDIGGENKAAMNEPNQVTEAWSVSMAGRVIRVLRTTKCYSDEKMKVLICVDENYYQMAINNKDDELIQDAPVNLRHLIIDSMEQAQATHKRGRPPTHPAILQQVMEEQMLLWLNALNNK